MPIRIDRSNCQRALSAQQEYCPAHCTSTSRTCRSRHSSACRTKNKMLSRWPRVQLCFFERESLPARHQCIRARVIVEYSARAGSVRWMARVDARAIFVSQFRTEPLGAMPLRGSHKIPPAPDAMRLEYSQLFFHSISEEWEPALSPLGMFRPIIKERRDYSCACMTGTGQVLPWAITCRAPGSMPASGCGGPRGSDVRTRR